MFENRADAGRRLGERLKSYGGRKSVVYGLPRGGVPVACQVSRMMGAILEVLIVKKIGVPGQEELALGAMTEGDPPAFYFNEELLRHLGLSVGQLAGIIDRKTAEIEDMRSLYRQGKPPPVYPDRVSIIVDDGLATGATMRAAIAFLKNHGVKKIVAAIPVGQADILSEISDLGVDVVCVEPVQFMSAVGEFYSDFSQVEHETVIQLLRSCGAIT